MVVEIEKKMNGTRVTGNTYSQSFSRDLKRRFHARADVVEKDLNKLDRFADLFKGNVRHGGIARHFEMMKTHFRKLVEIHEENEIIKTGIIDLLEKTSLSIDNMIGVYEKKQSALQMEGSDLSNIEFESMNALQDCRLGIVLQQSVYHQLAGNGDVRLFQRYRDIAKSKTFPSIGTVKMFAVSA